MEIVIYQRLSQYISIWDYSLSFKGRENRA